MSSRMRFFVLDVQEGSEEKSEIWLWGRTEKGEKAKVIDSSFSPYFYAEYRDGLEDSQVEDLMRKISELNLEGSKPVEVSRETGNYLGKEKHLIRITLPKNPDITRFRDQLKEWPEIKSKYEHSMSLRRRYLVDRKIKPMSWVYVEGNASAGSEIEIYAENIEPAGEEKPPKLSMLAFDLELVEENSEEKIVMISVKDNSGFRKVLTYKPVKLGYTEVVDDEKGLISRLCEIIRERNPDIILTYNGDRFDFQKLSDRATKHGLEIKMGRTGRKLIFTKRGRIYVAWTEGPVHVDLFSFVENIMSDSLSSEVLSLDMVSREIIGKGKKKMDWEELQKAWEESRGLERLARYCLKDSELTLSLAEHVVPQISELCRLTGQGLFDVSRMTYSQLVEWLLIRKAHENGQLIPNRPKYEEIQLRRKAVPYEGGFVYPPKGGIHKNISLFDFRGLYPSITVTHNVSPETLYCQCCGGEKKNAHRVPGEDYYYCRKHTGFVSETVSELIRKRAMIKKDMGKLEKDSAEYRRLHNRQHALKILSNSIYGYYGYAGSRWYSRVCAQSITAWGRHYIKKVIRKVERMGHDVIYGDTDSLFIKARGRKASEEILDKVNRTLPGIMELELQGTYSAGLFVQAKGGQTAKKRYALVDAEGELTIRGFEKVRRDWSRIARETQEKVLLSVLRDNSPEEALETVRRTVRKLEKGKVDMKKLVISTQLTRPIRDYEQIGPHVAAAKKSLSRGRPVGEGSLISYVITKGQGSISDRAEPSEDTETYDPDYYINNQVVPSALRVLSVLGYTEDDIKQEGEAQSSLDSFIRKSIKRRFKKGISRMKRKK